jgi:hypothetical protein
MFPLEACHHVPNPPVLTTECKVEAAHRVIDSGASSPMLLAKSV